MPVVVDALEDLLHASLVARSEVRMKKSFDAPRRGMSARKRSALRSASSLGSRPWRLGGVGDRLAVLVGAGEEEDVLAALAVVARHDVDRDRRVGVPEARAALT